MHQQALRTRAGNELYAMGWTQHTVGYPEHPGHVDHPGPPGQRGNRRRRCSGPPGGIQRPGLDGPGTAAPHPAGLSPTRGLDAPSRPLQRAENPQDQRGESLNWWKNFPSTRQVCCDPSPATNVPLEEAYIVPPQAGRRGGLFVAIALRPDVQESSQAFSPGA